MNKNNFVTIFVLIILLSYGHSYAHHSFVSTFSQDKMVTVEGTVTDFKFRNPHTLIYIDVVNPNGTVTNWMAESLSASTLRRMGWDRKDINKGDRLRVSGNATPDGSPMVWIVEIDYLDPGSNAVLAVLRPRENPKKAFGKIVEQSKRENKLTFLSPRLASGEPNFTGTTMRSAAFSPRRGPDANDMPLPYNEKGKHAYESFDITNDPQIFCDPPGVVRQAGYTPYGEKISQYPDRIEFIYEEFGTHRVVPISNELPGPGERSHMGDSVARYEEGKLIIETVNLLANPGGHNGQVLSDKISVKEVYSRRDLPEHGTLITIETTVNDPEYFTGPWTISRTKVYSESYEFIENECVPPLRERPIKPGMEG